MIRLSPSGKPTKKGRKDELTLKLTEYKSFDQIPLGDKGIIGERIDTVRTQNKRDKYEHLWRYKNAIKAIGSNKRILDLGCGTGYGTKMLYESGNYETYGIDISQKSIHYSKKTYPGPTYICCSAERLPFRDNFFNSITAFDTIEHVQDTEGYIREVYRILKNEGDLFISTPNIRHLSNTLKHLLLGRSYPEKVNINNIYHIKEFHYTEFLDFLQKNKFKIISKYGQTIPLIPTFYKIPLDLGKVLPNYAWTIVIHAKKNV